MNDRHALVCGGTGGLGLGVTPALLERGARVTVPVYAKEEVPRLEAVVSKESRARLRFVEADLADEGSVESLVNGMDRIDVLIHLVGGFSMGETHTYDYEAWKADFRLNLDTTFLACKHALRRMRKAGYGRIVTVGSRPAVDPVAGLPSYAAAKAGVVALTRVIAQETRGTGITANSVLPSVIDTPANRAAMGEKDAERWVKPASLAEVVCFLASEAARDVRGAAVAVYGDA